jgi:hypothetical protein
MQFDQLKRRKFGVGAGWSVAARAQQATDCGDGRGESAAGAAFHFGWRAGRFARSVGVRAVTGRPRNGTTPAVVLPDLVPARLCWTCRCAQHRASSCQQRAASAKVASALRSVADAERFSHSAAASRQSCTLSVSSLAIPMERRQRGKFPGAAP